MVGAWFWQTENSDVLPLGSVAVAVTDLQPTFVGTVMVKLALPLASVATAAKPIKVSPSPWPEGSQAVFEKNSRLKIVRGVLLSVPTIVVVAPEDETLVSTGKFCKRLPPSSGSPASLAVTPSVESVSLPLPLRS